MGCDMSVEDKLLRYKREMKETQSSLDQEKGSLTTIYSSLCDTLDIKKDTPNKSIEKKAQSKIKGINTKIEELTTEFEELMEEIEEELNEEEED